MGRADPKGPAVSTDRPSAGQPYPDPVNEMLAGMADDRLAGRVRFILELDRLKSVYRRSHVNTPKTAKAPEGVRMENTAEHSWHIAVVALLLHDMAEQPIDVFKVVTMLLVHDIIEIDAGDTFLYDTAGRATQEARETKAAERIFGLLPETDRKAMYKMWEEFEAGDTAEARFARGIDRLLPQLQHLNTDGKTWREHGIRRDQVNSTIATIQRGSSALAELSLHMIDAAVRHGQLADDPVQPKPKPRPQPTKAMPSDAIKQT